MRDILPMPDVPGDTLPNGIGSQLTAVGAFVVALSGYIPYLFAVLPAIYYAILIYESKTVQGWVERRNERRRKAKLAKIHDAVLSVEDPVEATKLAAKALVTGAEISAAKDVKVARDVAAAKMDVATNAAQALVEDKITVPVATAKVLVQRIVAGVTGPTDA